MVTLDHPVRTNTDEERANIEAKARRFLSTTFRAVARRSAGLRPANSCAVSSAGTDFVVWTLRTPFAC